MQDPPPASGQQIPHRQPTVWSGPNKPDCMWIRTRRPDELKPSCLFLFAGALCKNPLVSSQHIKNG